MHEYEDADQMEEEYKKQEEAELAKIRAGGGDVNNY